MSSSIRVRAMIRVKEQYSVQREQEGATSGQTEQTEKEHLIGRQAAPPLQT